MDKQNFKFLILVCSCLMSVSCTLNLDISSLTDLTKKQFKLLPPSADITENGTLQISGENGTPPYQYEKVMGGGTVAPDGAFSAAANSDLVMVKGTDATGKSAFAVFNVVAKPAIQPNTKTLAVTNSFHFSVIGGKAPYIFRISSGGGTISSLGEFVAPSSTGTVVLEVEDSLGGKGTATVTVVDALTVVPATMVTGANTQRTFTTTGGVPPVTFAMDSGGGSINASTGVYAAPGMAGTAVVKATDSLGNEARALITINGPLLINPAILELVTNATYTFTSSGGVPPYTYAVTSGAGTIAAATGVYIAPAAIGTEKITVTDSLGSTSTATININTALSFVFPNISMLTNESKDLSLNVIGGIAPISYSVSSGAGTINSSTGLFAAGNSPGTYTATVVDSQGHQAQASLIISPPVSISPTSPTMMATSQLTFSASGGFGPYTYSVVLGGGSFSGAQFTAPSTAQNVTVKVIDTLGHFATTVVTVQPILKISPETAAVMANHTIQFSAVGGIAPHTFYVTSGGGTIDSAGLFTASNIPGMTAVSVKDAEGHIATASVRVLDVLQLTPPSLAMTTSSSLTLLATGGEPPYSFSIFSGDGEINSSSGKFTSAATPGSVVVRVTDSLGNIATGNIDVHGSVLITPTSPTLVINETLTFGAVGGQGPYAYSVTSGTGTVDSTTGVYTATNTPGTALIRVTDSLNQISETTVTIAAALQILPLTPQIAVSNSQQFTALGGVPPYTFRVAAGLGTITTTGLFTAATSAGTSTIEVKDSGNRIATTTITVADALTLSPANKDLKYSESQTFTASQGVGPYTYSVLTGLGSIDSSSGVFVAPAQAGTTTIRAQDSLGNQATATVTTLAPVEITPTIKSLAFSETFTFQAVYGLPPYTFSKVSGLGTIHSASGLFTASASVGTTVVQVTDALNQTAQATITVYDALNLTPDISTIAVNQTQAFSISGGVGPYNYSVLSGAGSFDSGTLIFTASATPSTTKVKATDSLGNFDIVTVNSVGPVTISPATLTMIVNEEFTFAASGGKTPYTFAVLSGGGTINSSGKFVAPGSTGTSVVQVTDDLGQTASATITIDSALAISPTSATLAVGNTQQFTASGGRGPYTFTVVSGGGSVNASGLYTAGGSSGSTTVRVTDADNRTAEATVTIANALAISPSAKDLAFTQAQTFAASGGVPPYSYTVVVPGAGSVGVTTGAYVAPSVAGTETVRVTDALGNTANATVTIYGSVQISPTTKNMIIGQTFTFSAAGGKAPYAYSVSAGGGTIGASTGTLVASNTPGSYTVRVTDSLGQTSDAVVTLTPALDLQPNASTIKVGQTQVLNVVGGTAPFVFAITSGAGSFDSGTTTYTAPTSPTTAQIQVTDNLAYTDTSSITVTAGDSAALYFVTSAQSVFAGACSTVAEVGVKDSYGNVTTATSAYTVTPSQADMVFYSDASCATPITSKTLGIGATSTTFFFKSNISGMKTLTVSAPGLTDGTQIENIVAGTLTKVQFSPASLSFNAGDCSSVTQLRLADTHDNPGVPAADTSVTLTATGVTYYSDNTCSTVVSSPVVLTNGAPTKDLYLKKTLAGSSTVTASASGLTSGTLNLTVAAGAPSKLAFSIQPSTPVWSNTSFTQQPKVGIYDTYDNLVTTATNSIQLTAATNADCSTAAAGTITATSNPLAATAGEATFTGTKFSSVGAIYLKASSGGLTLACSTLVNVMADFSQTSSNIPGNIPHDGLAEATVLIIPKKDNLNLGAGNNIEVTSSSATMTFSCNGGTCDPCQSASPTCFKAFDNGKGAYSFAIKNTVQETVTLTVRHNDSGNLVGIKTLTTAFNTANFQTFSATSTLTSANAGQNLYLTGGTITFNATTNGVTFGDVFVRGATINHAATTAATVNKLNISVGSFTLQTGSINTNGLGYITNFSPGATSNHYSYGSTAPATTLGPGAQKWSSCSSGPSCYVYSSGGSHGGTGGQYSTLAIAEPYDDYRDPSYPGGAGASNGGGVVRISSSGLCTVYSGATITANSASYGGAGGSVKLTCSGFAGTAGSAAITANGGNGIAATQITGSEYANYGGGGGGRVALISTLEEASFIGNFVFPTTAQQVTDLTDRVRARGGGTAMFGGAGTIYLKHSDLTYGGLIVFGGGTSSTTTLLSLVKTTGVVSGSSLPFTTTINAAYADLYKNMRLRPDVALDNGTPDDLLDDNIVTITANTGSNVTVSGSLASVTSGKNLRTLEILDFLNIGGASTLASGSDIVVLNGNFIDSSSFNVTNGVISMVGNAKLYPALNTLTLSQYTYSSTNLATTNLVVSGGTLNATGSVTATSITVNTGSLTANSVNAVNLNLNGGTFNSVTSNITNNMTVTGGTNISYTNVIGNDLIISGGTNTFETSTVQRNFDMSAGTLQHRTATTTTVYKIEMSVGNNFTLSGGSINTSGLGYPTVILSGTNYSFGASSPLTLLGSAFQKWTGTCTTSTSECFYNASGGSHGGSGGQLAALAVGDVYDDYRNPSYPGGAGGRSGGGVVRVTATGLCTVGGTASIRANGGTYGGAGGSIMLNCSGFDGTLGSNAISATGGSGISATLLTSSEWATYGAGGGGRIALISTNGESSFTGNFAFPNDSTKMNSFIDRVRARGGTTPMPGTAGTIYVKHSGITYGGLIVSNGGTTGVTTLPSLVKTTGTVAGSSLPFTAALTAGYVNMYKNMRLRPNVAADNGTPDNLLDDNIVTISANSVSDTTISGSLAGVSSGQSMRTIEIFDYLNVSGSSSLATGSDIVVLSGDFISSGLLNLTNGLIAATGSAKVYPAIETASLSSGTFTGNNLSLKNLTVNGATVNLSGNIAAEEITVSSGGLTANNVTANNINVTGGSYAANSSAIANDLIISNGTNRSYANTIGRDFKISGGTNTFEGATIGRDFEISGGTLTHRPAITTAFYKILFDITGEARILGGSINVSGQGYATNFDVSGATANNYSFADGGTSILIGSSGKRWTSTCSGTSCFYNSGGGSHGGLGGAYSTYTSGPAFDDYKNPTYPGGAGGRPGGGVINIKAGLCTINNGATLNANGGTYGGAGGSIQLNCSGFAGTAGTGAITANGGPGVSNTQVTGAEYANYGAGGGGRIALISTGNELSFADNFTMPNTAAKMTSFLGRVQARGGATLPAGAGTIYLKHADLTYGGLIIYNGINGITTPFVSASTNSATVISKVNSNTVAVSASNPYANYLGYFKGYDFHIWPTATGNIDPLSPTHIAAKITGNTSNNFLVQGTPYASETISSDYKYRITHTVDALYVGGNGKVDLMSSDLVVNGNPSLACDFISPVIQNLDIPSGSSIVGGVSYSSVNCPSGGITGSKTFTSYCDGLGTCAP